MGWNIVSYLPVLAISAAFVWRISWLKSKRPLLSKGMSVEQRREELDDLRSFLFTIPMAGLLGTVISLISTLEYMGRRGANINEVSDVVSRFAPAMWTTLIGLLATIFLAFWLHQIFITFRDSE